LPRHGLDRDRHLGLLFVSRVVLQSRSEQSQHTHRAMPSVYSCKTAAADFCPDNIVAYALAMATMSVAVALTRWLALGHGRRGSGLCAR
jgi:hypothetical protein